jgi:GNAT superfamily N-acetyltransferase
VHADNQINHNKLIFDNFSEKDNFSSLDFTQADKSDPLDIDKFIHENPIRYIRYHISTIYSVKYEEKLIAYFTLSMCIIKTEELLGEDVREGIAYQNYPALLVGKIGVDKKIRNMGIGRAILLYCLGLAQTINDDVACSALILHTTRDMVGYYRKNGFKNIEPKSSKKLVTMYRTI